MATIISILQNKLFFYLQILLNSKKKNSKTSESHRRSVFEMITEDPLFCTCFIRFIRRAKIRSSKTDKIWMQCHWYFLHVLVFVIIHVRRYKIVILFTQLLAHTATRFGIVRVTFFTGTSRTGDIECFEEFFNFIGLFTRYCRHILCLLKLCRTQRLCLFLCVLLFGVFHCISFLLVDSRIE